jgi:proteasome assembly chaperone (PAC2) family protein
MISTGTVAMLYPQRSSVQPPLAERTCEGVLCLMIMDHVQFDREPPANLTTLVMAFGGWIDAGRAATGALRHLTRDLGAARLARIDPEEFFVLTQERPEVRLRSDGSREVQWALSEFSAWDPGQGRDGLLLFCGPEPHQRWRTYTKAFLDVAERCGVRRIVSLGALLAGVPHSRPVRVTARSSDPASRSLLEAWGIYRRPTYEGPTGISSVVLDEAERRGMQHVGFMGQAPHYLQDSENPAATQTLVSYVARLLELSPDMSGFAEAIHDFRTQCDQAVARDRATREHVRKLEQEYDAVTGEASPPLPGGELDSDTLMRDLQDFLRKQRGGS